MLSMALDILVREFAQDWMISQTNLFRFLQRKTRLIIQKVATRAADRQ
jgi:hypothetical protein